MNARNFQRELDRTLESIRREGMVPTLFLHSCCAPCSSYVLEYLSEYFKITVFYYNPNIYPEAEYTARVREQERLIGEFNEEMRLGAERAPKEEVAGGMEPFAARPRHPITFLAGEYKPEVYFEVVKGLEREEEGGARCTECFRLRLFEAARLAKEGGYDYFTTTLTVGPKKDAKRLNSLGEEAGALYGVRYLNSDFKKRDGHTRSIELSEAYGLYRQNYCGCVFSRQEMEGRSRESGQAVQGSFGESRQDNS